MAYARLLAMKLPIGSGAIESTVRRVVNLRLKGPSLFWCRANAEAILLLRSYYKAGRVEYVETYGDFTPCAAGNLTGKWERALSASHTADTRSRHAYKFSWSDAHSPSTIPASL